MLDLIRKDKIGESLDAQIAKFFDTYAAAKGLSKSLLPLFRLWSPIATFTRCKSDTAMEEIEFSIALEQ